MRYVSPEYERAAVEHRLKGRQARLARKLKLVRSLSEGPSEHPLPTEQFTGDGFVAFGQGSVPNQVGEVVLVFNKSGVSHGNGQVKDMGKRFNLRFEFDHLLSKLLNFRLF